MRWQCGFDEFDWKRFLRLPGLKKTDRIEWLESSWLFSEPKVARSGSIEAYPIDQETPVDLVRQIPLLLNNGCVAFIPFTLDGLPDVKGSVECIDAKTYEFTFNDPNFWGDSLNFGYMFYKAGDLLVSHTARCTGEFRCEAMRCDFYIKRTRWAQLDHPMDAYIKAALPK